MRRIPANRIEFIDNEKNTEKFKIAVNNKM